MIEKIQESYRCWYDEENLLRNSQKILIQQEEFRRKLKEHAKKCSHAMTYFSRKIYEVFELLRVRYFFSGLKKSSDDTNVPAVVDLVQSKTLTVVKPDSKLFKKPKPRHRPKWKYSPVGFFQDTVREMFPLKSIYRLDMSQGMAQLYEDINEQIDLQYFHSTFNMPNTMASWIKICELHVFLLCAKFRPEQDLGKAAIDYLMIAYYNDVEYRSRRLAPCTSFHKREELRKFKRYTYYIFMGYDEGIQENDMVLAAALWRRFFGFKCDDFTLVERMVKYVRIQLMHLHSIKFRDLIFYRQKLFVPLSEVTLEKSTALVPVGLKDRQKRKLYSSTLYWINDKTYRF